MTDVARIALCALLGLLWAGCAGSEGRSQPRPSQLPEATHTCILTRTISSWRALGRDRLEVDSRPPKIIHFYSPCYGLGGTEAIAFSSNDGRICDYRSDSVIVRGEYCRIAAIRPPPDEQIERTNAELDEYERSLEEATEGETP